MCYVYDGIFQCMYESVQVMVSLSWLVWCMSCTDQYLVIVREHGSCMTCFNITQLKFMHITKHRQTKPQLPLCSYY